MIYYWEMVLQLTPTAPLENQEIKEKLLDCQHDLMTFNYFFGFILVVKDRPALESLILFPCKRSRGAH